MDGSAHSVVVAPGPKMQTARPLIIGLIVIATLLASFMVGRLTARSGDGVPAGPGSSQVVVNDAGGPPLRDGDVKRG
jgi:hypothetical protein